MTRTGRTLYEYMQQGAAGLVALCHFVKHLSADSVLVTEMGGHEGQREWSERQRTNALLADIYDNISGFRYMFASSKSKKKPRKPEPYPRPWMKPRKKKLGKDPIPVSKFWDWWDKKMKEAEDAIR